jgi:hypothetical protein
MEPVANTTLHNAVQDEEAARSLACFEATPIDRPTQGASLCCMFQHFSLFGKTHAEKSRCIFALHASVFSIVSLFGGTQAGKNLFMLYCFLHLFLLRLVVGNGPTQTRSMLTAYECANLTVYLCKSAVPLQKGICTTAGPYTYSFG